MCSDKHTDLNIFKQIYRMQLHFTARFLDIFAHVQSFKLLSRTPSICSLSNLRLGLSQPPQQSQDIDLSTVQFTYILEAYKLQIKTKANGENSERNILKKKTSDEMTIQFFSIPLLPIPMAETSEQGFQKNLRRNQKYEYKGRVIETRETAKGKVCLASNLKRKED